MRTQRHAWKRVVYHDASSARRLWWRRMHRGASGFFTALPGRPVIPHAVASGVCIIAAVFFLIGGYALIPQEYPDLIYQGYIFGQKIFHGNDFGGAYAIHSYIPPGILSTLFIGIGSQMVAASIAGEIFLLLSMISVYAGVYLFLGITVPGNNLLRGMIAFSFLFGYHFWFGDLNFSFGFGLALAGIYLLVSRRWMERPVPVALLFVLCYLSHFSSFLILALGGLAWIVAGRRYDLLRKVLPAMLPVLAVFVDYLINADTPYAVDRPYPTLYRYLHDRAVIVAAMLAPFTDRDGNLGVYGAWGARGVDFINMGYLVLLAGMIALAIRNIWNIRDEQARFNFLLALLSAIMVLALPLNIAGIFYPANGFALFFLANILALLVLRLPQAAVVLAPLYLLLNIGMGWMTADLLESFRMVGERCSGEDYISIGPPGEIDHSAHEEARGIIYWLEHPERELRPELRRIPVHPSGIIHSLPLTQEELKRYPRP